MLLKKGIHCLVLSSCIMILLFVFCQYLEPDMLTDMRSQQLENDRLLQTDDSEIIPEIVYVGHWQPFVSVIDFVNLTEVTKVFVEAGRAMNSSVARNGKFGYIAASYPPGLHQFDTGSHTVTATVLFEQGTRTADLALMPDGRTAYMTLFDGHGIACVDVTTMTIQTIIPLTEDDYPNGIMIGPGGQFCFIANQNSGRIHVIDTKNNTISAVIETGYESVNELAVTQNGRYILGTLGNVADGVIVIDIPDLNIIKYINVGNSPRDVAIPRNGREAYVACWGTQEISVIDTEILELIDAIALPRGPYRIAVNLNGKFACVGTAGYQVFKVDLVDREVVGLAEVEGFPWGVTFLSGHEEE